MRESVTYMAIIEEGGIEALQRTLLRLGRKKFGQPDEAITAAIKSINDLGRLERMAERLLDVSSWPDLLATA
jgi:hypothetical protein